MGQNQAVDDSGVGVFNSGTWDSLDQSTNPEFRSFGHCFYCAVLTVMKVLMNSVWHEWWKARDVSSLSRGSKVEVVIHNIPCVVHWKLTRSTPSTDFQFSPFKAKILNLLVRYRSSGSWRYWRPDLLHSDCCLAALSANCVAAYGNTRHQIQKSSLDSLCLCIRHSRRVSHWRLNFLGWWGLIVQG